ncbi:MAG: hypothetical protein IKW48_00990 [Akkermansia sp.]|nr:hypothetical protein [Akkermansia sp.]
MQVIASAFLVDDLSIVSGNAETYPRGKPGSPEQICSLHSYYGSAGCELVHLAARNPGSFQGAAPF